MVDNNPSTPTALRSPDQTSYSSAVKGTRTTLNLSIWMYICIMYLYIYICMLVCVYIYTYGQVRV